MFVFQQIDISGSKYINIWQITSPREYIISFGRAGAKRRWGPALTLTGDEGSPVLRLYMITEQKTIILDGELKLTNQRLPICREGPKALVLKIGRRRSTQPLLNFNMSHKIER